MMYGRYEDLRNATWQVIIDFNINSLPVALSDITDKLDIKILNNSDVNHLKEGERGVTLKFGDDWYIVVNDAESVPIRRFTIAHELGHILLGHMLIDKAKYRTFKVRNPEEQEADMFAARLLAPACILHEIKALTPDQIKHVCNISITAARVRAERMAILEARNKYYLHPLERQVRQQFSEFISKNIAK